MKIGFTCGAFDLLHAGHIHLLESAKFQCDYLIVGLHIDPSKERPGKNKPIESLLERQIRLRACKYVDEIIVYETEADLLKILESIVISERYIGSDYADTNKKITGEEIIPVYTITSLPIHTSDIRERIKNG